MVIFPFLARSTYEIVCTLQPPNPLKNPRHWERAVILYSLTAQVHFFFGKVYLLLSYFPSFSSDFLIVWYPFPFVLHHLWFRILSLSQNCATSCSLPTISICIWSFHFLKENSVNFILLLKNLHAFFSNPYPSFLNAGWAIICPAWFPTSCGGDRRLYCLSWVLSVLVTYSWEVLCLGTGC